MGIQIVTLLDFDFQYARHDLDNIQIQWGSEIWTSFKCSKKGWLANGPDFEWNLASGSSTICNLDKVATHFFKNHLKFGKKCVFELLGLQLKLYQGPFENQTI